MSNPIARWILNYIGALIRFIIGTIYRKILNKTLYTFTDYLNGQKKKKKTIFQTN